jgi:hypothetical protein
MHSHIYHVHYGMLLTYSMQQSPSWEANWFAASQEIPRILWNQRVYYRIHKRPTPVSVLRQLNPVHIPHPTSWRSILILSSHLRLGLPSGLFPSGFLTKTVYTSLPYPSELHVQPISFFSILSPHNSGWGVQVIELLIMMFSPHLCYLVPLRPKYSPQHPVLTMACFGP